MAQAMARKPRVHFPGALYHVIARGNQRQKVFRSDLDRARYLELLSRYQKRYRFRLYAYVLMANHVHLLVEARLTPLAKVMQGLQQSYTLYFNRKYGLVGHLFQGRYKAILCDRDSYLLELVRYLHLNPVRSKLVKEPSEYPWSSHRCYLGKPLKVEVDIETDLILSQFSPRRSQAVRRYKEFLLEGISEGHREDLYAAKEQRYLGDEQFVERVRSRIEKEPSQAIRIDLADIEEAACGRYGLSPELLRSKSKDRRGSFGRMVVAYLGQELGGIKLSDVAKRYGRDQVSLSLGLKGLRERMTKEAGLRQSVEDLTEGLRNARRRK